MAIVIEVDFDEGSGSPVEKVGGGSLSRQAGTEVWEDLSALPNGKMALKVDSSTWWQLPVVNPFPSAAITVRLVRKLNATGGENPNFSLSTLTGTHGCWARCPDATSSNKIRWSFGATDAVQWTGYTPNTTGIELWAFTASAAGGQIYYQGTSRASSASSITRASTQNPALRLNNDVFTNSHGQMSYLRLLVDNTRLDDAAIAAWAANPYGLSQEPASTGGRTARLRRRRRHRR